MADGEYRLAEASETGKTTVLTTGASGTLQVEGIATGEKKQRHQMAAMCFLMVKSRLR